jgi:linoleoyl-CoA desaturase
MPTHQVVATTQVSDLTMIGSQPLNVTRSRRQVAGMILGKLAHLTWAVLIPLACNPWWAVLAFYLTCSWLVGFFLATTFQMAHCVDEADFVPSTTPCRGASFQLHQLRTTVNIRRGALSRSLRWLIGGLDHQIEHHLAPRLPHTIHPLIGRRLELACSEHELTYRVHQSTWAALRSHARWLKVMGRRPEATLER